MSYTLAIVATLLLPTVNCQIPYGNFSSNAYLSSSSSPSSPLVATQTAATARGIGDYIFAALGGNTGVRKTTPPPSNPTDNLSRHYEPMTKAFGNESMSGTGTGSPPVSTYCEMGGGKCFTDITYSAMSIAPTGSGSAYASSCSTVLSSYASASESWDKVHNSLEVETQALGGTRTTVVTYYENATTLCDGHPRVTYSPAVSLSTGTLTTPGTPTATSYYTNTVGWMFPVQSPVCSIGTSDCNPLWTSYSSSRSQWDAQQTGATFSPMITQSPSPPPCANASAVLAQSSAESWLHDCGPCTIFGEGVQLFYFPPTTTTPRDMCASAPSATVTWFGDNVGTPYDGIGLPHVDSLGGPPPVTAVVDGKTFTSGTAYISISNIYTGDRCAASAGSAVTSAILELPSESVLSLRYSQDHFQFFYSVSTVTGYPFNYEDLQRPIPYSAWVGQEMCENSYDQSCNVIYEEDFNPQLAMPPGVRKINPEWERCQMYYRGLYDPPYALQPGTAIGVATGPGIRDTTTSPTPKPAPPISSSMPIATTFPDQDKSDSTDAASSLGIAGATLPNTQPTATASATAETTKKDLVYSATGVEVTVGAAVYTIAVGPSGAVTVDGSAVPAGSSVGIPGVVVSVGSGNVVIASSGSGSGSGSGSDSDRGSTTIPFSGLGSVVATSTAVLAEERIEEAIVTFGGSAATILKTSGSSNAVMGSITLSENGEAHTIAPGEVISLAPDGNGVVVVKQATGGAAGSGSGSGSGSVSSDAATTFTQAFSTVEIDAAVTTASTSGSPSSSASSSSSRSGTTSTHAGSSQSGSSGSGSSSAAANTESNSGGVSVSFSSALPLQLLVSASTVLVTALVCILL